MAVNAAWMVISVFSSLWFWVKKINSKRNVSLVFHVYFFLHWKRRFHVICFSKPKYMVKIWKWKWRGTTKIKLIYRRLFTESLHTFCKYRKPRVSSTIFLLIGCLILSSYAQKTVKSLWVFLGMSILPFSWKCLSCLFYVNDVFSLGFFLMLHLYYIQIIAYLDLWQT